MSDLIQTAIAAFNALSPEQQQQMMEEQRQSWVRGNVGLSRDEGRMTSPVKPTPTTTGKCGELVTVAWRFRDTWEGGHKYWKFTERHFKLEDAEFQDLCLRSQAEELLAAERAEKEEARKSWQEAAAMYAQEKARVDPALKRISVLETQLAAAIAIWDELPDNTSSLAAMSAWFLKAGPIIKKARATLGGTEG